MPISPVYPEAKRLRLPFWLGVCLFTGIALFFLWEEHRAHLFGALPYLLLLLCPLLHGLMHGRHGSSQPHGHRPSASTTRNEVRHD